MGRASLSPLFCAIVTVLASACAGAQGGLELEPADLQSVNIHFDVGGRLPATTSGFFMLGRAAEILRLDRDLRLLIVGHTDATGTPEANQALAFDRAAFVKGFMVDLVPSTEQQIRTAFYGEDRPVYDNATEDGRAANRRVEFRFYRTGSDQKVEAELQGLYNGKLVFSTQTTVPVQAQTKAP